MNINQTINNQINNENTYAYWIDVLKVTATFLVVLQHNISQEWAQGQINTPYWYLLNGIFSIARMGVPIFFMCSGYGMLQKKRSIREIYTKYIYNLLFIYVMWMQVYGISSILRMIIHREGNIRVYLNAYIKAIILGHYHVWFIFALCGLYAMVPLLERVAEEKRLLQYGIVISFGATILFPYTSMLPGFSRMEYTLGSLDLHNLTGYLLYFLVGYYLEKNGSEKVRKNLIYIGITAFVLANFTSILLSLRTQEANQNPYDCFGLPGFFMCVGFYLIFKDIKVKEQAYKKYWKPIMTCGFGVYLVHPLFLFLNQNLHGTIRVLSTFVIYGISLGICLLLNCSPITRNMFIRHQKNTM